MSPLASHLTVCSQLGAYFPLNGYSLPPIPHQKENKASTFLNASHVAMPQVNSSPHQIKICLQS